MLTRAEGPATRFDADWIIIGSGFGGAVSALRLAEKGYKVIVLESGKRWRQEDFPRTNWSIRKFLWLPKFFCYGFFRMTLLEDVLVLGGAGVGGGSLVYANTLLVPPDEAFAAPGWPRDRDWWAVLAPHYETAKRMLGVAATPREFAADTLLRESAEEIGRGHTFKLTNVGVYFGVPNETVPDPYFGGEGPERTGCTFCGGCMVGCRFGAKNTLDKNYLWLAERRGVSIVPETHVDLIRPIRPGESEVDGRSGSGGYELVTRRSTGVFRRTATTYRAKNVILSAGVLGTVELLMRSQKLGTLERLSPRLGARVRTNSEAIIGATARSSRTSYSEGVAIGSGMHLEDGTHIEAVRYPEGSDALSCLGTLLADGGSSLRRITNWLGEAVSHPIDFLRSLSPFGWARRTVILLVMQTKESSMNLRLARRWFSPLRGVLTSFRSTDQPRIPTYIKAANDFARVVARRQNGFASSAINEIALDVPTTAHILSGCALALTPDEGVIDTKNEVFGHPGLYVVDGSMIPSNLGVNPSLTITALAEYAMSQIPKKESDPNGGGHGEAATAKGVRDDRA